MQYEACAQTDSSSVAAMEGVVCGLWRARSPSSIHEIITCGDTEF
jgi:hypothetical protein